jgi:hypothetical protein
MSRHRLVPIVCALAFLLAAPPTARAEGADSPTPLGWPTPTRTARPWSRWWWLGSAVDRPNIERLLAQYRDAGLGGVEICPIYGAKGYEARFIDYLSRRWMDMLAATTDSAARLDMGVDMTTGTGWPMGGPWVPADEASESVTLRRIPLTTNGPLPGLSQFLPPERGAQSTGPAAARVLICLRAVGPGGSQVDLTNRFHSGVLDWAPPGNGWSLYALSSRQPIQHVKRAAPGGQGNVIDPYSTESLNTYLSRFDQAFQGYRGAMPRSQFHDSFEYYDANWTPHLLAEFARRRGYDLRDRLPELSGGGDPDAAARVRFDYRQTIGELHREFVAAWTSWSHAHGSLTREQAHGAPANIEDVYATADIPETEGAFGGSSDEQVPMLKFASSAAHVTGRNLASSETFTWAGEHFQVPLSQLKSVADTFLLSGVNHIFFHGIPYSPSDAPWPGWLFYASVNLGPNGGLWHDLPAFNAYLTRCQSILQAGRPDNDLLLYFPVADTWQAPGGGATQPLLLPFSTPGKWLAGTPFQAAAMELWHKGISFDEVTDGLLEGSQVEDRPRQASGDRKGINLGGNHYRVILVPTCRYMPVTTLVRLLGLAKDGATIVFEGDIPSDVPGLPDLERRRGELRALAAGLAFLQTGPQVRTARIGKGLVLSGAGTSPLMALLESAGVDRERMADNGILSIRRSRGTGTDYFIVNTSATRFANWVPLARRAESAVLLDPLEPSSSGIARTRRGKEADSVFLQMAPGQSYVLRTLSDEVAAGAPWPYSCPTARSIIPLSGKWSVHFSEGGPALPGDFETQSLGSWTDRDDPEAKRFAGTAIYQLHFNLGVDPRTATDWRLDLGRVAESARVRLNGRDAGILWVPPFSTKVGSLLRQGENLLEVEVTNTAANRIRDLDLRHVEWKRFYEINFVNRSYAPFDASGWSLRDSGLLGPVTLVPLACAPGADIPPSN